MLPPPPMLTIKFRRSNLILLLGLLALLVGCTPSGPRALLQGKRLIDDEKYPQAVEKLKTATVLLGTNALAAAQAWNYLGVAYHHVGDTAASEKAYQRALSLNHDLAEAHYNLGCLLLSQNKLDSARTEFTAYALRRGNSPEGFLKLGTVQLRARDFSAAEKSFNDVLRLSPQNAEALNSLGLVRVQQRRFSDAAQCFAGALKSQPDYRAALLNLAIVNQNYLKDRNAALQKYREYLALKPAPANAEAVAETIRQLEQEANPPSRPVATNPGQAPVVVPPPGRPAQTNVARAAVPPRTEPPTNTQKPVTPPVTTARPQPTVSNPAPPSTVTAAPPPAVEVVKLEAEPTIKPAQDLAAKAPPSRASAAAPLVTTSSVPATANSTKTTKRGFLDSINPLNLFHNGDKTPTRTTPLPPSGSQSQGAGNASNSTPAASGGAGTPANVNYLRYAYKSPAAPAAGDHAAAQRACDQAMQAYREHRVVDAAQSYRQATQLDPAFYEAQYNYGLAATDAGNLAAALSAYEYALAIRPDSADARYNFALVLKQSRYYTDAANELEKLLAAHPNEARAHLALANLYAQQLSQPSLAHQQYMKVLDLEPKNPQASEIRLWLKAHPQ